jgi:hypothetical protein
MKTCSKCNLVKALDCFYKDKYQKDGYKTSCKECSRNSHSAWVKNNSAAANEHALKSYQKRKEKISKRRKELRASNPEHYRDKAKETRSKNLAHYRRRSRENGWKYAGIVDMTYDRYLDMLEKQNRCCAICNDPQEILARNLCVDHNHTTGEARGLLCDKCNFAIGYFKESRLLLEKAINYLDMHNEK